MITMGRWATTTPTAPPPAMAHDRYLWTVGELLAQLSQARAIWGTWAMATEPHTGSLKVTTWATNANVTSRSGRSDLARRARGAAGARSAAGRRPWPCTR